MATLLHLDSSADSSTSRSRAITAAFAAAFGSASDANRITYRDVHAEPLPHLADASMHWPARLRADDAVVPAAAGTLQDALIAELVAADVLLVGAPMYNYSLPSSLKAWLDHIHVPGETAPFDVRSQPMKGRPAVVVTSRGTAFDAGTPSAGNDHAVPVLQLILGDALGMDLTVIATSLTLATTVAALSTQRPRAEAEYAQALDEAAKLGHQMGSATPGDGISGEKPAER